MLEKIKALWTLFKGSKEAIVAVIVLSVMLFVGGAGVATAIILIVTRGFK